MGLGSLTQGIDGNGDAERLATQADQSTLDTSLNDLIATLAPTLRIGLATSTSAAGWDNGGVIDLTVGGTIVPEFVHVGVAEDTYLNADTETTPTNNGAIYYSGLTHVIPCRGATKLHFKQVSAAGAVSPTVFGKAV